MRLRLKRNHVYLIFILLLVALGVSTLAYRTINLGTFQRGQEDTPLGLRLGLDLQGGTHLVYRAVDPNVTAEQMRGVAKVIERRVNAYGVAESLVQLKGRNEVVIQLPGVSDIDQAKRLIGGTAQLEFRQCSNTAITRAGLCPNWEPAVAQGAGGVQKVLTGAFLKPNSLVQADPSTGLPEVRFEFNDEGADMFEQITRRLIGKPLGIFLDNQIVSAPTVQSVISQTGVINGVSVDEAKLLSIQLNAGALPVAIAVVREQDISASLGKDSLEASYIAAIMGMAMVMVFMIVYYRLPGLLAAVSLGIYAILVLSIFKLFPITLTTSGIAGFVVSVGMAVDAHVLIFERTREELRAGRSLAGAIEVGHNRAWTAIRDSHVATVLAMVILWWFGSELGEPRVIGFAVTLIIATLMSMFTSIFVTHTFLRTITGARWAQKMALYAPVRPGIRPAPREGGIRGPVLDFIKPRRWFYYTTAALAVAAVIALIIPPRLPWGLEFTSGSSLELEFTNPTKKITSQEVRAELKKIGIEESTIQSTGDNAFFVRVPRRESNLEAVLKEKFGDGVTVNNLDTATDLSATVSFVTPVPEDIVKSALGTATGLVLSRTSDGKYFITAGNITKADLEAKLKTLEARYGPAGVTSFDAEGDLAVTLDFGPAVLPSDIEAEAKKVSEAIKVVNIGSNNYFLVAPGIGTDVKNTLFASLEQRFGRYGSTAYNKPEDMALVLKFKDRPTIEALRNELFAKGFGAAYAAPSGDKDFVVAGQNFTQKKRDELVKALKDKFGDVTSTPLDTQSGLALAVNFGPTVTQEGFIATVPTIEPTAVAAVTTNNVYFLGAKGLTKERQDKLLADLESILGLAKRAPVDFTKVVAASVNFKDPVSLQDVQGALAAIPIKDTVGTRAKVERLAPDTYLLVGTGIDPEEQTLMLAVVESKLGALEKKEFSDSDLRMVLDFGPTVGTVGIRTEVATQDPNVSVEPLQTNQYFLVAENVAPEKRDAILKALDTKFGPAKRIDYQATTAYASILIFEKDITVPVLRSAISTAGFSSAGVAVSPSAVNTFYVAIPELAEDKRAGFLKTLTDTLGPVQEKPFDFTKGIALGVDFGTTPTLASIEKDILDGKFEGVQVVDSGKGFVFVGRGVSKERADALRTTLKTKYGPAAASAFDPKTNMAVQIRLTDPTKVAAAASALGVIVQKSGPNQFFIGGQQMPAERRQQIFQALQDALGQIDPQPYDFAVGMVSMITLPSGISPEVVKTTLEPVGYINLTLEPRGGNTYFLRSDRPEAGQRNLIVDTLESGLGPVNRSTLEFSFVDAEIAQRSVINTIVAVIASCVGIMLYVWWAFRRAPRAFRFGVAVIVGLLHDIVLVLGVFGLMAKFRTVEIDSLMIVGVLAIIGYSVSNTIIVLDRLRENLTKYSSVEFELVANATLGETLTRNMNTTVTIVAAILAVFLFGGATTANFMLELLIGVIAGLYSSLFLAIQILVTWEKWERSKAPKAVRPTAATPRTQPRGATP